MKVRLKRRAESTQGRAPCCDAPLEDRDHGLWSCSECGMTYTVMSPT